MASGQSVHMQSGLLASIGFLQDSLEVDEFLCYAHWSVVDNAKGRLDWAAQQLRFWLEAFVRYEKQLLDMIVDYLLYQSFFVENPMG